MNTDKHEQTEEKIKNQPKADDFDKEKSTSYSNSDNVAKTDAKSDEEKENLSRQKDSD